MLFRNFCALSAQINILSCQIKYKASNKASSFKGSFLQYDFKIPNYKTQDSQGKTGTGISNSEVMTHETIPDCSCEDLP